MLSRRASAPPPLPSAPPSPASPASSVSAPLRSPPLRPRSASGEKTGSGARLRRAEEVPAGVRRARRGVARSPRGKKAHKGPRRHDGEGAGGTRHAAAPDRTPVGAPGNKEGEALPGTPRVTGGGQGPTGVGALGHVPRAVTGNGRSISVSARSLRG